MSSHDVRNTRKAEQGRKRDERAVRKAHQSNRKQKELSTSYFLEDENYAGFSNQLAVIGLKLRDIPGDGNCLFRALADQLEGHSRNHQRHREEVVKYMIDHRSDFEPFVEDDCSFDDHVYKLRQDGTYAGNDAIVAFARKNGVNVVIHQLNAPMWTITGNERGNVTQLHIAYHNGDHYSSIRKIDDNSDRPAAIKLVTKAENKQNAFKRESKRKQASPGGVARKQIQQIANVTGCQDSKLIQQLLEENDYNIDATIGIILQTVSSPEMSDEDPNESSIKPHSSKGKKVTGHPQLWESNGTGARLFGSQNIHKKNDVKKKTSQPPKQLSNKNRKEQARKERKKRNEERKKSNTSTPSQTTLSDSDDSEIILKNMAILRI